MAMLRAGADIVGYELREEFADRANANVHSFLGDDFVARYRRRAPQLLRRHRGDRPRSVVLDLPEPWQVVKHAERALRPGGIFVAYTPSITQAVTLRETMAESRFTMAETLEVLHRSWHIEGQICAPRSPHGGPHGVPDIGPPSRRLTTAWTAST